MRQIEDHVAGTVVGGPVALVVAAAAQLAPAASAPRPSASGSEAT